MNYADLAKEKNATGFQATVEAALSEKVAAALDAKKVEVAQTFFNQVTPQVATEETEQLDEKKYIHDIKKGAFHAWLGKSTDEPITDADIEKGLKAGGHAAKMANFAKNARHFHHGNK